MKQELLYNSKTSDNIFETIVNNLQEGILTTDKDDRIIYINPCMEKILCQKEKDLLGLVFSADVPIETLQNAIQYYLKAKSTLEPVKYLAKVVTPSGQTTVQEGWCIPRKENNEYNGITICVVRDITDQRREDTALRARESQWECLYSILPVGVSIFDEQNNITEFNIALGRILEITDVGLQQGLYKKRRYLRADGTPMPADEFPNIRAVQEQRTIRDIEIGVKKESGEIIWTQVSAAPLNLPGISCIVSTTDITEQNLLSVV